VKLTAQIRLLPRLGMSGFTPLPLLCSFRRAHRQYYTYVYSMANLQAAAWAGGLQIYAVAEYVNLIISHGQPAVVFSPSLQTI
jgi:hypothetical protein